ncbi:cobyric acid synthase [Leucothrix mucor]|uniref:cobyric acid synthase n=1 Tax=Leucothrix mucor TaxID=45248 RepID=UPI0003B33259|nr:cobyric acid synthase [Leucothrix mucor]
MTKKSTINHIPVGNGDMTLIKIASNDRYHYVLIDMHIRKNSEPDDDKCDALMALHEMLEKDVEGRPYLDALVLTHPDEDHIRGFEDHFHRGVPGAYVAPKKGERGKIFVREIWSSPMIMRRKKKNESLCTDAAAFKTEAKRRVELFRANKTIGQQGDRVRLIGKDEGGKTDDIMDIVYQNEDVIDKINEAFIKELSALVLGPLTDDEFEDGTSPDKNRSSIIMQWGLASHGYTEPSNYILLAGDAGVEVWDLMWGKYKNDTSKLKYDILLAPHHCSWHTLSHDSIKDSDSPQVSKSAKSALSEARPGAIIASSSDEIKNNKNDPPNYKAMKEYESIVNEVDGKFQCLADYKPSGGKTPEVLTYKLTKNGPQEETKASSASSSVGKEAARTAATGTLFTGAGNAIGHG